MISIKVEPALAPYRQAPWLVLNMIRNPDSVFTGTIENLRVESPQHVINVLDACRSQRMTAITVQKTFSDPKSSLFVIATQTFHQPVLETLRHPNGEGELHQILGKAINLDGIGLRRNMRVDCCLHYFARFNTNALRQGCSKLFQRVGLAGAAIGSGSLVLFHLLLLSLLTTLRVNE